MHPGDEDGGTATSATKNIHAVVNYLDGGMSIKIIRHLWKERYHLMVHHLWHSYYIDDAWLVLVKILLKK